MLNERNLFLPKDFGAFLGFFECLQSIDDPFTIHGFVISSQPRADERVFVTEFSGRKADAASVWAAGPASTPANVFTVVLVVPVFIVLSVNPYETGFISSGHPPFSGFHRGQFFQLDFDPALSGCFRLRPRPVLGEREILLIVDAFSHQASHHTFGGFVLRRVH